MVLCWRLGGNFKKKEDVLRPKVMALYENTNLLLEKVKLELSVKEEEFVRQSLATRAILSPKTLIKDHKTINEKEEFPNRLVIPATNFTGTFSKIGYLGIKRCLEKEKSEIFTRFHCPGLQPEGKTRTTRVKERRGNNRISGCNKHVPIDKNCDNKEGGEIFCKKTHQRDQEDNQPLLGPHPLRDDIHPHLLRR